MYTIGFIQANSLDWNKLVYESYVSVRWIAQFTESVLITKSQVQALSNNYSATIF